MHTGICHIYAINRTIAHEAMKCAASNLNISLNIPRDLTHLSKLLAHLLLIRLYLLSNLLRRRFSRDQGDLLDHR